MSGGVELKVRVAAVTEMADRIRRFRLVRMDGGDMPVFSGGAHTVVSMPDGDRLRRNPYSLMGSPLDRSAYEISVLRTLDSRGGSAFMHEKVREGTELTISYPVNLFPLDQRAKKHLFIAGGIGVTPFMAMTAQLAHQDGRFEMHYAMRGRAEGAYWRTLMEAYGHRVSTVFDNEGEKLDLEAILSRQPIGTSLYVCGPGAMIDWVLLTARNLGWPEEALHSERFLAPSGGKPFTVELALSKKTIAVGEHMSLLEAIEAAGVDAPYLCRGGACGQCETSILACEGRLVHADHFLTPEEKASGKKIMPCVSRFEGARLVLER
jgi:dimethylamine monooxygenase subunit B